MRGVAEDLHVGERRRAHEPIGRKLHDAKHDADDGADGNRQDADQHIHGKTLAEIGQPFQQHLSERGIENQPQHDGNQHAAQKNGAERQLLRRLCWRDHRAH